MIEKILDRKVAITMAERNEENFDNLGNCRFCGEPSEKLSKQNSGNQRAGINARLICKTCSK